MKKQTLKGVLGVVAILSCLLGSVTLVRAADYLVRPDDKLRIKIFQFPELSGDYTVSTTGTVLIPPIGEIVVAGSSAIDISTQISRRFAAAGISDKPGATAEVIQSQPIYILGDVQKPGEYSYRPGVTVLQAISLAGGWFRVNDPGLMRLDREAITITGDLQGLIKRYYQLSAQRARFNAELGLRNDVAFSADVMRRAAADPAVAELLDEERSFLSINVDALNKHLEGLERTRQLYQKEIEAVSRQIEANKVQWQSVEMELSDIKSLYTRGLTTVSRKTNLERQQSQIEMTEQGYQTLILRAQQSISQVDEKIFDLKSTRQAKLTADLQRTRVDLDDVVARLQTSRNLMTEVQFTRPNVLSNLPSIIEGRNLTIIRTQDGKSTTIEAEEGTELHPGDVLKVERSIIPSSVASGAAIPGMDDIPGHNLFTPTSGRPGRRGR